MSKKGFQGNRRISSGRGGPDMGDKSDRDIQRLKQIVGKVAEDSKIRLDQMIQDFIAHPDLKEITLPNLLTSMERAYVHFQATKHGLKSLSYGSGPERRLTLRRATESVSLETKSVSLTANSLDGIGMLIDAFLNPMPGSSSELGCNGEHRNRNSQALKPGDACGSRLATGTVPKIPRYRKSRSYVDYQSRLPIWQHRTQILQQIERSRVVFIRGSTGCGKTTQVPQYLLDNGANNSTKVRIICTVPRRIAAVTVSERVAQERGERLGQTVGYQIRLESRISPTETLLTYCTSGVLLRSLSNSDYAVLKNTTHIIIDEIHERDRQTDFLLACLRDILSHFPHLRLILMGADLNNELFSAYFGGEHECPIIQVEGRLHPVQVYYLEDVLEILRYQNYEMKTTKHHEQKADVYNRLVESLSENLPVIHSNAIDQDTQKATGRDDVDHMIQLFWSTGDEDVFNEFMYLLNEQLISVNYQHSSIGATMLMAAAARGLMDYVRALLSIGADVGIKMKTETGDFSAIEWATDHNQHEVLKLLLEHRYTTKLMPTLTETFMSPESSARLASYLRSIDEERVDLLLILSLLSQIHLNAKSNDAILVFLPGYDEIVTLKHLLMTDNRLGFRHGTFIVFMLHSNIQTGDQRAAFEKPPKGVRKIVLSTNIAESSLTIEDIVYVIDSGKAKEKSFDSLTSVTQLKSVWISKASVNQRRGRAGRCLQGICYHLFSSARYESMAEFPVPEIVRTSLQELCLHARSFMTTDVKIEQFFSRIPEPPAPIAVKKSVELLKVMGALDENETLTKLGSHLVDFPLEPFLGKALIFAVVFRCLDPVLTLVAIISYRDPFQLPSDPRDKQKAQECKTRFAKESFSDHMAYLKAFQDWEKSKLFTEGTERKYCRENYLSSATFEMVYAIRAQLLGQLRASGFVMTKGKLDITELNQNSNNWPLVKGVLVATLYPNVCGINRSKKVLYNSFNSKISFHPSTTVVKKKNDVPDINVDWIVFDEMTQQGPTNLVKGCTCVSTPAVALFAGSFQDKETVEDDLDFDFNRCESGMNLLTPMSKLKINQWIILHGGSETIDSLLFLRKQINRLVLRKLESPSAISTMDDESIIKIVSALLVNEDNAVGFKTVEGIGQWPKMVSGNFMSTPRAGFGKSSNCASEKYLFSTKSTTARFFIIELEEVLLAHQILKSGVWLVPGFLAERFPVCRSEDAKGDELDIVIFFWVRAVKLFTGVIRVRIAAQMSLLDEVPFQILGEKVASLENVLLQIKERPDFNLPMNGVELDYDFAAALLKVL